MSKKTDEDEIKRIDSLPFLMERHEAVFLVSSQGRPRGQAMNDDGLVKRLNAQHNDLRQGAYYRPSEDPEWDATGDAAARIKELEAEREAAYRQGWEDARSGMVDPPPEATP